MALQAKTPPLGQPAPGSPGYSFYNKQKRSMDQKKPSGLGKISDTVNTAIGTAKTAMQNRALGASPAKPTWAPQGPSYVSQAVPTSLPQFALQRQQAQSRLQGQAQTQREALNRKFAQLGGGPSGAAIKHGQILGDTLARQQEEALGGINVQELGAIQALQEAEKGRAFQAGQADVGRTFESTMADVARQQQAEQFAKQFGLSKKEVLANLKSQREADIHNQATALAALKGDQLERYLSYYNNLGGRGDFGDVNTSSGGVGATPRPIQTRPPVGGGRPGPLSRRGGF